MTHTHKHKQLQQRSSQGGVLKDSAREKLTSALQVSDSRKSEVRSNICGNFTVYCILYHICNYSILLFFNIF